MTIGIYTPVLRNVRMHKFSISLIVNVFAERIYLP